MGEGEGDEASMAMPKIETPPLTVCSAAAPTHTHVHAHRHSRVEGGREGGKW